MLCAASCIEGPVLGRTSCHHVRHAFDLRDTDLPIGTEPVFVCRRSDILFKDVATLIDAAGQIDDTALAHRKRFGAKLDNTTENGEIYPTVGYDQEQLETELGDRVVRAAEVSGVDLASAGAGVLDVGCSSGPLLRALRRRHSRLPLFGIDPSPTSIAIAARVPGADVTVGTLPDLDESIGELDGVAILGNLMLHPNPHQTLREAARRTRSGGFLVVDVKSIRSSPRRLARIAARIPLLGRSGAIRRLLDRTHHGMQHGLHLDWLRAAVAEAGWTVVSTRGVAPRRLAIRNDAASRRSMSSVAWQLLDGVDRRVGERAWVEVVARLP